MKNFNPFKNFNNAKKIAEAKAEEEFLKGYEKLTMEYGYRLLSKMMIINQERTMAQAVLVPVKFDKDKLIEEQLKLNNNKKDVGNDKQEMSEVQKEV